MVRRLRYITQICQKILMQKKLLCIAIDSYCQNKGRKHKVKPKDKQGKYTMVTVLIQQTLLL